MRSDEVLVNRGACYLEFGCDWLRMEFDISNVKVEMDRNRWYSWLVSEHPAI